MDLVNDDRSAAPLPSAFAVAIAFVSAIAVTSVAVAAGATHHQVEALLPLGVVTLGIALWTSQAGAVAVAWICWALDSGFVLGRQAQLSFSPLSQRAVLLLIGLAVLGSCAGQLVRRGRLRSARVRSR